MQHFQDGMVFFRPHDIVSGDFYWYSEANSPKVILTAVDCTGHGVPGAFMSMIGNDLLNGIVDTDEVTDPGTVLDKLSIAVRQTLQQEQNDNRDGMDMALITYDREKRELAFAGAKNPLLYIQNGEAHLVKGDRMSIGGDVGLDERYTTHRIPLTGRGETTCYMFSDGFQDQFGGKKGRKYMTKRFHKFLASIHHLPMSEQHGKIEAEFTAWLTSESRIEPEQQVDDILVVGFKL